MFLCDCKYIEGGKLNINCILNGLFFGLLFAILCIMVENVFSNEVQRKISSLQKHNAKFCSDICVGLAVHIFIFYKKFKN